MGETISALVAGAARRRFNANMPSLFQALSNHCEIDMRLSRLSYSAAPWKRCSFASPGLTVEPSPSVDLICRSRLPRQCGVHFNNYETG